MASTADCKKLIEQDPLVRGTIGAAARVWKRLSKRTAPDGVERVFQDQQGAWFVRVLEDGQGGLTVAAVAPSLAEIGCPATSTDRVPSKQVFAVKPGRLCWSHNDDPVAQRAAQHAVRQILGEADMEDGVDPAVLRQAGTALANRMLFAVHGGVDKEGELLVLNEGVHEVGVVIVPDTYWEQTRCWLDQPLLIEPLFAPRAAYSPNGSSLYMLSGHATVKDTVWMLLDQGFVWDASLQDSLSDADEPPPPWLKDWLAAGAPGKPVKAMGSPSQTPRSRPS